MSFPARCAHNVIRCDVCMKESAEDEKGSENRATVARAALRAVTELQTENQALRDRVKGLERDLADVGETVFDLKSQLRQYRELNEELRSVQSGRRS